jgi:hypothetical protein
MKNRAVPQLWEEEIDFLKHIVSSLPNGACIVEIGTAQGGGFEIISKSRRNPHKIEVHTFDPFPGEFVKQIQKENPNTYCNPLDSVKAAKEWGKNKKTSVSLIVIDGNHSLESVYNDYMAWMPFLVKSSLILFHDYDDDRRFGVSHPGVKVFCDALTLGVPKEKITRRGRYLLTRYEDVKKVKLQSLKTSFKNWIDQGFSVAENLVSNQKTTISDFSIIHSRSSLMGKNNITSDCLCNDLALTINCIKIYNQSHENFLCKSKSRAKKLKQLEVLDMFLIAHGWEMIFQNKKNVFQLITQRKTIKEISQLCAALMVLGNLCDNLLLENN